MSRPVFVFDVDGTLIDTRPSFNRIVREISGAADDEIERFRDTGGFNDDWELARALCCWIGAGRPDIVERCDSVRDVILWCSHDPGDLSARCIDLYRGIDGRSGYWRDEVVLVDGDRLRALAARGDVVSCTGRDAWEFENAQKQIGFTFAKATTMEVAKKPDPTALLRLLPEASPSTTLRPSLVVLFGDTHADRRTVLEARRRRPELNLAFVHVSEERPLRPLVDAMLAASDEAGLIAAVVDAAER